MLVLPPYRDRPTLSVFPFVLEADLLAADLCLPIALESGALGRIIPSCSLVRVTFSDNISLLDDRFCWGKMISLLPLRFFCRASMYLDFFHFFIKNLFCRDKSSPCAYVPAFLRASLSSCLGSPHPCPS